jgi:hypothetical protein
VARYLYYLEAVVLLDAERADRAQELCDVLALVTHTHRHVL